MNNHFYLAKFQVQQMFAKSITGHRKCNFPTKIDVTTTKQRSKVYNILVEKRCDKNTIDLEYDTTILTFIHVFICAW